MHKTAEGLFLVAVKWEMRVLKYFTQLFRERLIDAGPSFVAARYPDLKDLSLVHFFQARGGIGSPHTEGFSGPGALSLFRVCSSKKPRIALSPSSLEPSD